MGEVYRATDTRLKRDVAIKILPEVVATDPDRLARFQREAEVLAALNHPNIAQIHGLEEADGTKALVMELVEGPTLADRIAGGKLPVDEALPIARQIAEALEAAHEQGIIHRDLKPSNIKVREDGTVKVLDFGLAKALESAGTALAGATESPTITSPAMTQAGTILGTAAYMSPEQARGKAVDRRADIWAFGCVLYEMLTGRRAFDGDDVRDLMVAVCRDEPAWDALPAATPATVNILLRRCLQKDPQKRLPHLGIARLELGEDHSPAPPPDRTDGRPRLRLVDRLGGMILGAAIVAGGVAAWPTPESSPPPAGRFEISAPLLEYAEGEHLSVSPDGAWIAINADGIHVRRLDSADFTGTPVTEPVRGPFWSPDSRSVAFVVDRELRRLTIGDNEPRLVARLADRPMYTTGAAGAWGADDTILLSLGGPLQVFRGDTGRVEPLGPLDEAAGEFAQTAPTFLPDGRRFFYLSNRRGTAVDQVTRLRSLDTGAVQDLPGLDGVILWAGDRHVLYRRDTALFAQAIGYAPLSLLGTPVQLAADVSQTAGQVASASSSTLVYRSSRALPQQLTWLARDGSTLGRLGPTGRYPTFSISRDGSRVVVTRAEPGAQNLWTIDVARGTMSRVTAGASSDVDPRLSPDGRSVIFGSTRDPARSPYRATIAGQPPERLFAFKGATFALDDWSADGRWLLYHDVNVPEIMAARLDEPDAKPVTVANAIAGRLDQAVMSPDGRWVAYNSSESRRSEVYVVPFPPTGDRWPVSVDGGAQPTWRADSGELYYLALDGSRFLFTLLTDDGGPTLTVLTSWPTLAAGRER